MGSLFLPTPSARRATAEADAAKIAADAISTHALREEGDCSSHTGRPAAGYFYPRPPRGGRLTSARTAPERVHFYPRPPRGGRPYLTYDLVTSAWHFYPRPPRGGRLCIFKNLVNIVSFLPTPSARRATFLEKCIAPCLFGFLPTPSARRATFGSKRSFFQQAISTHALREEGDNGQSSCNAFLRLFLPTPSARRATASVRGRQHHGQFLPTPSARRATQ